MNQSEAIQELKSKGYQLVPGPTTTGGFWMKPNDQAKRAVIIQVAGGVYEIDEFEANLKYVSR